VRVPTPLGSWAEQQLSSAREGSGEFMNLLDAILSVAGLVLWLLWREAGFLDRSRLAPAGLLSTLRPAQPVVRRSHSLLLGLFFLLVLRAFFYWHIGAALDWMPRLQLIAVTVTFRSDFLDRMLLYSLLSWLRIGAFFYFSLLLLSAVNEAIGETDPCQKRVRLHLGSVDRWPAFLKLGAPFIVGFGFWAAINPLLAWCGLIPATSGWPSLGRQAALVGLGAFYSWQWLIVVFLAIQVLNNYLFLGNFAVLGFVQATAHNLLRPLTFIPLKWGKVDTGPIAAILLVVILTEMGARQLSLWFSRLPV
jgi:hypothetical protein